MLIVKGTFHISPGPLQREFASILAEIAFKYPDAVELRTTRAGYVYLEDADGMTIARAIGFSNCGTETEREERLIRSCIRLAAVYAPSERKDIELPF